MAQDIITATLQQPHGWAMLAGVAMLGGFWIYHNWFTPEETYSSTTLESVAKESIYAAIEENGQELHTKLRKGLVDLGYIRKVDKIFTDEDPLRDVDLDEEGKKAEKVVENSGREVPDEHDKRVYARFIVYPTGLLNRVMSYIPGIRKRVEKIFIVPAVYVNRGDQVELNRFIELHEVGGVWLAKNIKSIKPVEDMAISELLEDNLERDINWIKFMNWKERQLSQDMLRREKINELKQQYYGSRSDAAVEDDV